MAQKYPYSVQAEINRLTKSGMSIKEATELALYDYAIEHDEKTEFDLTPEQEKASKEMRSTGTRKTTTYNFKKRERKPNETKRKIIEFLFKVINAETLFENATISNIERQIDFSVNEKSYSLTLTEHRPKKE